LIVIAFRTAFAQRQSTSDETPIGVRSFLAWRWPVKKRANLPSGCDLYRDTIYTGCLQKEIMAQPHPMGAFVTRQPRLADHSADRRMILLAGLALVVGTGSAGAAWLLLKLIALVTNLAWYGRLSANSASITEAAGGIGTLLIPIIGSLLIGLMVRFGSPKIRGHGIPEAIEAILYGQSRLSLKVALLKPLSSAVSIGSGGPFGAEGPIIMTGGAIGSLSAQCFNLSGAERKTLLVAGAAAGMTAIFGTPVAAMLLAIEVMLFEWKPRSFVPVVAGALTASAWRPLLIGTGPLFPFAGAVPAYPWLLPVAAIVGLASGVIASLLSAALYRLEDGFHRLPIHWMWWPALAAIIVGLGGLIDPRVLGAGYGNIQALLDGHWALKAILLLLVVKTVVWLAALSSGTSGGILAPLLSIGGALGGVIGLWLPGGSGFWALAGMAAMMSAGMRAPLTGAVFAVELTGRLDALPATAAAAVAGYALAVLVLRRSILTEKVARRGRHLSHEYGVDPLALVRTSEVMAKDPATLPASMRTGDALIFFEQGARHRSYPVVDDSGRPVGLVSREDALRWRTAAPDEDETLHDRVSDKSLAVATPDMPAIQAAELMIAEEIGRLPVVDPASGKLVGILARRDLLNARAKSTEEETKRKRYVKPRIPAVA